MAELKIQVDYRERELIGVAEADENGVATKMKFEVCNLPVGDVCYGGTSTQSAPLLLVERKTWSDLVASIKDGRFRQQKERSLEATGDAGKILFIIEGSKKSIKRSDIKIVDGAILNLLFKHQMKVLFTADPTETWSAIKTIKGKLSDPATPSPAVVVPVAVGGLKSRGDKINENVLAAQLSVIPGISFKMGLKVAEVYRTMNDLMLAYNRLSDQKAREGMLAAIRLNDTRTIGKLTSAKIYKALFC